MSDFIVRATAADAQIRVFVAYTKELVEEARSRHNTSPVATAALGRLLTAGAMMGSMLKGEKDILTLKVNGGGPIEGITVTADSKGRVKGYVGNPNVILPANSVGKLDVAGAVGLGFLDVIKDLGMKEPYVGQTVLQTSEIAEDLTYYFATSEQIPSSVGLGVLMNKNNTVAQAGGFIIQLMPFATEEVISKLEENLSQVKSVTSLLDQGYGPLELLDILCKDLHPVVNDQIETCFYCNCSRQRVEKALISIGRDEINEIIADGEDITMNCHFCNTDYVFEIDYLRDLAQKI
ncbi:MAG: Hsp33 family molecular chaperone HslO [Lachnospiraceae bacterium]|nr:Hsp33 family molecular chaperone HslO [Lachnospiraceae bacterium]